MVQLFDSAALRPDGRIDQEVWLEEIGKSHNQEQYNLIRNACVLARLAGEDHAVFTGESCWQLGLAMANTLLQYNMDAETLAAALVFPSVQYAELAVEDVQEHLGKPIGVLLEGIEQLEALRSLHGHSTDHSQTQIETLRKMLLAMVQDVRVVLVKLAERACLLHKATHLSKEERRFLAHETMEIFAPLANRLGVSTIKWELEDLSFRDLQSEQYKAIAKSLSSRRVERERYIKNYVANLNQMMESASISAEISGRAKHIYSIYRKMQRKNVDFNEIYDALAVRILVNTVEDCYAALSAVHSCWGHIDHEFDDYIATPKPNGYRSIHTAVVADESQIVEIQIRTHAMHEECELGMAAHWVYKEGAPKSSGFEQKINWLRQVLDWQRELTDTESHKKLLDQTIIDDRIYVFTPGGDIMDIQKGSTPLDFAYYIHSEIGNRCRGAKVNNKIVPLTYQLNTGDRVEILTNKTPQPSRDWLNTHLGFLKTPRARAKVHHWFKHQDYEKNVELGQQILNTEVKRLNLNKLNLDEIAPNFNYKNGQELLEAIGCGNLRSTQIISWLQRQQSKKDAVQIGPELRTVPSTQTRVEDITIHGVGNLLTKIAHCCRPLPGDQIIGYVTQGQGVSIHRQDCPNILYAHEHYANRLIEVAWGESTQGSYPVEVFVEAYDRHGLLHDITNIITNVQINLIGLSSNLDKEENIVKLKLKLEISSLALLSQVTGKIQQLPNVIDVQRLG